MVALAEVMATLRAECPWDRGQSHASLRRYLLEETYETLEALDHVAEQPSSARAFDDLCEELGDLVFQVVFHAHLANEAGRFDLSDVIDGVRTKLEARHPAIFDPAADDGLGWEQAKVAEKGRASVMDGIPPALPALVYATKVIGKAEAAASFEMTDTPEVAAPADEAQLGRDLLALVTAARKAGLDPEGSLRSAARKLETQVRRSDG